MPAPSSNRDQHGTGFTRLGRYVVTGTLGQGAMGTVYRAEDPLIERKVALKILSLDLSEQDRAQFREHFFREGKSAGRLNHPNIVTVYDIGESEGVPYIAMEFMQGLTLRETLDMGNVMPVRRVVDIGLAVCRGLDFAHGQGIIHRDIKPANIMLTRSGMVKIMDFGIARSGIKLSPEVVTNHGLVLGSPKYMAPEQVQGLEVDARADLFSLGVTLYELLVGRNPFESDSVEEVIDKVLHLDPPSPRSKNPDVPEAVDQLVQRAMHKDPAQRFESARDMGRVLRVLRQELRAARAQQQARTLPARAPSPGDASAATLVIPPTRSRSPAAATTRKAAPKSGSRTLRLAGAAVAVVLATAVAVSMLGRDEPAPVVTEAPPLPARKALEVTEVNVFAPPILPMPPVDELPPVFARVEPAPAAAPPRAARVRPSPLPAATVSGQASVKLSVLPWGQVFVDGQLAGVTPPLRSLELSPGHHRIEIRNLDFPPYVSDLRLESGGDHVIRHRFGK